MIFDGKPAESITLEEIRQLVADKIAEDRHLDFKERPYDTSDRGRAELLKDVTAFLNADGGYLIIGIGEDGSGRAERFASVADPDSVRRSILDRCLQGIDPRPPHLNVGFHAVDGNTVVIVHVAESDRKPHCARPDAEHQYFWRRYEDGNKLMTTAEIRECLEEDRVYRELGELRREITHVRHERVREREMDRDVSETELLELQSMDAFLKHVENHFVRDISSRGYYRLFACPVSVNQVDLCEHATALRKLLANPPALREQGWDLRPLDAPRVSAMGVEAGDASYHNVRVFRNGYVEFRTPADDESFHWAQSGNPQPVNPHAIIEPAACFVLLVQEVFRLASYQGQLRFGLGLFNIKGTCLLPYGTDAVGYRLSSYRLGQPDGPQPFPEKYLKAPEVNICASDLPGDVAWRLVSHVYYRFGYTDEMIPFFDDGHKCTLGNR